MKLGFIDYYLDEWHANNYPARIKELSGGSIEVAYAYAEIDSPKGGLTTDEWCEKYGVTRVDCIERLVELSDGIVVLSPDNCERHEQLCKVPLASGKPCYVDKTFAPDKATAERIFAIAKAHNTPCYSSSALRYAEEYADIDRDGIVAISSWGPARGPMCGFDIYSIHQLEPIVMLMQTKPKKVMMNTSDDIYYVMTVLFEDGRVASINGYGTGSMYMMNISCRPKNIIVDVKSDFFGGFLKELVRFFETGRADIDPDETISIMALREAGLKALSAPGRWIDVE